jgi:hypothetical protein
VHSTPRRSHARPSSVSASSALRPVPFRPLSGEGDFFFDEAEVMAGLDPDTRAAVMAERLEVGMDLDQGAEENGAREDLEEVRRGGAPCERKQ